MSTLFIGCNFYEHDSAIFVINPESKDVFAIATERLTRWKHDKLFAIPSLEAYIHNQKINPSAIKQIYFANTFLSRQKEMFYPNAYELSLAERKHFGEPFIKEYEAKKATLRNKKLKKLFDYASTSVGRCILKEKIKSIFGLTKKISVEAFERLHLQKLFPNAEIIIDFYDHQTCHALSSYMTSPFEKTLLFSYDGWGDDLFSRVFVADNGSLTPIASSPCPKVRVSETVYPFEILGSPAGIYAYFTHLLGYKPTSEEGKVEALAAFGNYKNEIYDNLIPLFVIDKNKKSLIIDQNKTDFLQKESLLKVIEKYKKEDVAAAVQKFLEYTTHAYLTFLKEKVGFDSICLSGGASANVIMNLDIYEHITPNIHITPAMADDGTAFGGAVLSLLKYGHAFSELTWLKGETMPYYGTSYTKAEVLDHISKSPFKEKIDYIDLGDAWPEATAELVAEGKVGAIFHGRMEWGPRALGNRSIIADPRIPGFREKINKTIKRRPIFQPFCPSILEEEKDRLFESAYLNKHMTCAFRMKKEFWDQLPSAIHIDGTARAQFVGEKDNPNYFRLLKKVKELTGFGIIINTSFNKHGRTIVETPADAILDFIDTDMDYVIIEGIKITRK